MKWASPLLFLVVCSLAQEHKVIYGEDNRKEVYEVSDPIWLQLASATAGFLG